jgi:hypothetical protein
MAPDKHEIDLIEDRIRRADADGKGGRKMKNELKTERLEIVPGTGNVFRDLAVHSIAEREAGIARAALIEGEESGASTPFDFEAFIAQKQERKGP